jgi:hypothetical protein
MEAMVRIETERSAQEKQSVFKYRGWAVDPERIERFRNRYHKTEVERSSPSPGISHIVQSQQASALIEYRNSIMH